MSLNNQQEDDDIREEPLLKNEKPETVELMHDLRFSAFKSGQEFQQINLFEIGYLTRIMKAMVILYFSFYSVYAVLILSLYFSQMMKRIDEQTYDEADWKVLSWFKFGLYFCISVTVFYFTQMILMNKIHFRNRLYHFILIFLITIIKLTYYIWIIVGFSLYFKDVNMNGNTKLNVLAVGMLVLTILNLLDICRTAMSCGVLVSCHTVMKRRARRFRLQQWQQIEDREIRLNELEAQINEEPSPADQENPVAQENRRRPRDTQDIICRDLEQYYRLRELNRHEARFIKKSFKLIEVEESKLKLKKERHDDVCPICCENMTSAVQLTCDPRHIFHKECIQMWLLKNRNCPLCKHKII